MILCPHKPTKLILCLVLSTYLSLPAQQIIYDGEDDSFSPTFDSRYRKRGELRLSDECQDLIKKKRVKKMNVYDRGGILFSFFEFDNQGKVTGEGYRSRLYFTVKRKHQSGQEEVTTLAQYLGPVLMRADTTSIIQHLYKNADTSMVYTEYKNTVYKRGILINDQNQFYNNTYFGRTPQYRTDYDTTFLYLCAEIDTAANFEGSLRQGFINLDTNSLKEQAFYKKFRKHAIWNYYVEGESLVEPEKNPFWFCGTKAPDLTQTEESLNKNGLFDSHYYFSEGECVLAFYARYEYYTEQD